MHRSRIALTLTAVGMLMILSSCAAGPNTLAGGDGQAAGFWLGLWQGLIIPITFIVSLFNSHVSIYEVYNNGNWYDFGFMLGISADSPVDRGPACLIAHGDAVAERMRTCELRPPT